MNIIHFETGNDGTERRTEANWSERRKRAPTRQLLAK